jgi:hypothetical protein
MAEVKDVILKTREDLKKLDEENSEFAENYYKKYVKAREDVGLDMDTEKAGQNFMKFLVEDAVLPGIDDEEGESKSQ